GLLVNGIGLAFVASQVVLARRQFQHAQKANQTEIIRQKRQSTIDFYMMTIEQRTEWKTILPDDWDEAAIHKFIDAAYKSEENATLRHISDYLGYFETLAVAVSAEIYDLEILDSLAGSRIQSLAKNYEPYFTQVRRLTGRPSLFVELESLGKKLQEIR